ncbi:MAG: orotidine-5'-phosphate decarboxylase [Candidatus Scalinduaceae bacterium]
MKRFIDLLTKMIEKKDSCVVVGLDPQLEYVPDQIKKAAFKKKGSEAKKSAKAIIDFNKQIINIIQPHIGIVKIQIAFYELLGIWGIKAYSDTIKYAKKKGLIVIGDVKRGDVPHTSMAYAIAHLGTNKPDEGSFEVDAVTVNPYMGSDSVLPFIKLAKKYGKGVFILVKTSNPSSKEIQDLKCKNKTIYQIVANQINQWGKDQIGEKGYSSIGAVVASTNSNIVSNLRNIMPKSYFLVPGYGAQEGRLKDIARCFNHDGHGAIVNSSRGIIYAYNRSPWKRKFGIKRWECAVEEAIIEMNKELRNTTTYIKETK